MKRKRRVTKSPIVPANVITSNFVPWYIAQFDGT